MKHTGSVAEVVTMLESELSTDSLERVLSAIAAISEQDSEQTKQEIAEQVQAINERKSAKIRVY